MAEKLRILLADDNAAVLRYVEHLLRENFEIVAALRDGKLVTRDADTLRPDLIILDISMGDVTGFDVAQELRASRCRSKIIFLSVHQEFEFIQAALDVGASGYVFKSRMHSDLPAAIDAVCHGKVFLPENDPPHATATGT